MDPAVCFSDVYLTSRHAVAMGATSSGLRRAKPSLDVVTLAGAWVSGGASGRGEVMGGTRQKGGSSVSRATASGSPGVGYVDHKASVQLQYPEGRSGAHSESELRPAFGGAGELGILEDLVTGWVHARQRLPHLAWIGGHTGVARRCPDARLQDGTALDRDGGAGRVLDRPVGTVCPSWSAGAPGAVIWRTSPSLRAAFAIPGLRSAAR